MAEQSDKSTSALVTKILQRQRDMERACDMIKDDLVEIQKRLDLNRLDLKTVLRNEQELRQHPRERV